MRVLGFGTYDLDKHPRIGIVLEGLRARGDEVVVVNGPLGFTTAERVAMLGSPVLALRLAARVLRRWVQLARHGRQVRATGPFDAVLVGYLGQFDVLLARLLFPGAPLVLDMLIFGADTARDRGVTSAWKLRLLDALDRLAVRCASIVLLDTDEARALLSPRAARKAVVVPVGAERRWFAADPGPARRPASPGLRVVFFGMYTPLHGATVIGEALALLAHRDDITVTMIGTGQDHAAARSLAAGNSAVTWLDWVEPDRLPRLVAEHDVCLGIFGTSPKAMRVVPNKVYEGAAAGCAVVTSDTAPQRRSFEDAVHLVEPGDPAALAKALEHLSDEPGRVAELRAAAGAIAARHFTPEAVVSDLRTLLLSAAAPVTAPAEPAPLPPLAIRAWLRYDVVSRVLDRLRPATVLELGCGQGAFGARLAGEVDYLGVEPDPSSCAVAAQRIEPRGGRVLNATSDAVPAGATFDVVCAFEVLEHLEDDAAALAAWTTFVRPGGHLVLSVPAFQDRFGPMDVHAGHFRRYSADELRRRLVDAGLVVEQLTVYGWPLGYALEAVRNRIDAKKLAAAEARGASVEELTAASGRTFQPSKKLAGTAVAALTTPFRHLQRLAPRRGIGLVAVARRPVLPSDG